jgi:hypothetical protein
MGLEVHRENLSHTRSDYFDSIAIQATGQPRLVAMSNITTFVVCTYTDQLLTENGQLVDPLASAIFTVAPISSSPFLS